MSGWRASFGMTSPSALSRGEFGRVAATVAEGQAQIDLEVQLLSGKINNSPQLAWACGPPALG